MIGEIILQKSPYYLLQAFHFALKERHHNINALRKIPTAFWELEKLSSYFLLVIFTEHTDHQFLLIADLPDLENGFLFRLGKIAIQQLSGFPSEFNIC